MPCGPPGPCPVPKNKLELEAFRFSNKRGGTGTGRVPTAELASLSEQRRPRPGWRLTTSNFGPAAGSARWPTAADPSVRSAFRQAGSAPAWPSGA